MRIALYHNLPSGGAKRAVYEWTKRLSNEHTLDVYSLATADHTFSDIRPYTQNYLIYPFTTKRLFNKPLGRLNQLQRWRDLGELDHLSRKIAIEINHGEYDVLFSNTCMFTFIPILQSYVDIPTVYYLHEPFGVHFSRNIDRPYLNINRRQDILDRYDPLIHLYYHRLEKIQYASVYNTTRLLANSEFTRNEIHSAFGVYPKISPLGVDTSSFHPAPNIQREKFVLSVGELSPRKGFDFIVKSLGVIPDYYRPALIIACNNVIPQEKSFIEQLAVEYRVDLQILNNLNTNDLCLLYNRALACVYAPVMEPFGLVPLEAMACGTPVIGVCEGGLQESIVHESTGLLVERDYKKFGSAVEYLISNPNLLEILGQNARDHVLEKWSWDQSVSELDRHLKESILG